MKKAILLLGMTIFVAGILCFRNADADTILMKQPVSLEGLVKDTEELIQTEQEAAAGEMPQETTETEAPAEVTIPAEVSNAGSIAFLRLSLEEQRVYSEILTSLLGLHKETTLSIKDPSLIDIAFQCVMLDHPEIFYVDGYKYTEYSNGDVIEKIVFSGNYIYDDEEIRSRQEQISQVVAGIIANAPDTEDEYEKVKYVYETIIRNTRYDTASVDNQNICSVFLNGASVCQGYAKAVQYLLREMGIESGLVVGTVRQGDGHAWNLVSVNDNWYYVDATWGDAYYLFGGEEQNAMTGKTESVNYDYLCVTTEQLKQTHTINMPVTLPECTSLTDNYYVREGLYFESYDEERIRELFARSQEAGKETVTIKCSDSTVYECVCTSLLEEQKVFEFIQTSSGSIAYTDNKEQCCITFWL